MIKKILNVIGILCVVVGVSCFLMKNQISQRDYVDLSVRNPGVLVFYKDTCDTCRKIYPKIYLRSLRHLKVPQFVNLNNKGNKKYIRQFNLKQVPTIINTKSGLRYTGVNMDKINRVMVLQSKK